MAIESTELTTKEETVNILNSALKYAIIPGSQRVLENSNTKNKSWDMCSDILGTIAYCSQMGHIYILFPEIDTTNIKEPKPEEIENDPKYKEEKELVDSSVIVANEAEEKYLANKDDKEAEKKYKMTKEISKIHTDNYSKMLKDSRIAKIKAEKIAQRNITYPNNFDKFWVKPSVEKPNTQELLSVQIFTNDIENYTFIVSVFPNTLKCIIWEAINSNDKFIKEKIAVVEDLVSGGKFDSAKFIINSKQLGDGYLLVSSGKTIFKWKIEDLKQQKFLGQKSYKFFKLDIID